MHFKITVFIILIFSVTQSWSMVTVGSSPGNGSCTYANIQEALDSNDPLIRVLNNQEFIANITIDHTVEIRGGFTTCQEATNGDPVTTNTIIKGTNLIGAAVITIDSVNETSVNIFNLTLQDATDTPFIANGGHGINLLSLTGTLALWDTIIKNNTSEKGGGIYLGESSGSINLYIKDSEISGNSASIMGGGIYCEGSNLNGHYIIVSGESIISDNSAENGGGAAIINDCAAFFYSGLENSDSNGLYGIIGNHASQSGGGLFLDNGGYVNIGYPIIVPQQVKLATVKNNTADEDGAGVYIINESYVLINDANIDSNVAGRNGGGIYIGSNSTMAMGPVQNQCS